MKFSIKLSIARNISEKQLLLICITSNNQKMATLNRTQHRVSMRADENGGFIARSSSLIREIKNLVYKQTANGRFQLTIFSK